MSKKIGSDDPRSLIEYTFGDKVHLQQSRDPWYPIMAVHQTKD